MFPGVDGFEWSPGHLVFLGAFFSVISVVFTTFMISLARSAKDLKAQCTESIRWRSDFEDMPTEARKCRHEITGELSRRTCPHAFDCRECATHASLVASGSNCARPAENAECGDPAPFGFSMPLDRLYHRGHTWVHREKDGNFLVGMDDLGARLLGKPDGVEMPQIGTRLRTNGTAWRARRGKSVIRILSPIDGEVIALGGLENGWYLKVRSLPEGTDTRHLLQGEEVRPWLLRELERLQISLAGTGVGHSLADGGEPVRDFTKADPGADWDSVWGDMFLEP